MWAHSPLTPPSPAPLQVWEVMRGTWEVMRLTPHPTLSLPPQTPRVQCMPSPSPCPPKHPGFSACPGHQFQASRGPLVVGQGRRAGRRHVHRGRRPAGIQRTAAPKPGGRGGGRAWPRSVGWACAPAVRQGPVGCTMLRCVCYVMPTYAPYFIID